MSTYRIWAKCITYAYIDIEAEDEDEAWEKAVDTDPSGFIDTANGDWELMPEVEEL